MQGLEEELANEFDLNVSTSDSEESCSDSSNSESGTEADDTRFVRFLKGIGNPREEFPEDDSQQDVSLSRPLPAFFRNMLM